MSPLHWRTLTAFAGIALASSAIAEGATIEVAPSQHWMTITTCNEFRATIFVAFAYPEDGDWTSRGWLRVPPNTCKSAQLPTTTFSYRAETTPYKNGEYTIGHEWGGPQRFCAAKGRFAFHRASGGCGEQLAEFSRTHSAGGNVRLTFRADGRHTDYVLW